MDMKNLTHKHDRSLVRKIAANIIASAVYLIPVLVFSLSVSGPIFSEVNGGNIAIHSTVGSASGSQSALGQTTQVQTFSDGPRASGSPGSSWWDPQYELDVQEDPGSVNEEYGRQNATTEMITSVVPVNHPPTGSNERRITVPVNVSQNASIDLNAISDPDNDPISWTFTYHDASQVSWDENTKQLVVSFSQTVGATAEVVVLVQDLKQDLSPRGGNYTMVITLVRVP